MKSGNTSPRWVTLTALLLVALWQPATAHEWLESVGWIHGPNHDHQGVPHDAADGRCLVGQTGGTLHRPDFSDAADELFPSATLAAVESEYRWQPTPRILRLSTAPPPLRVSWQFARRAAPPARAPSIRR